MFGSSILEVAIGMVFIYLLMSLICTAANEIIEAWLKNRATDLERGLRELFNQKGGGGLVESFYNHPLVSGLFPGKYRREAEKAIGVMDFLRRTNLPSYIPARNFTYAIFDLLLHPPANGQGGLDDERPAGGAPVDVTPVPLSMEAVRAAIMRKEGHQLFGPQVRRVLRTLAEQSGDDLNQMRENVEAWFNGSMDRVSGTYKRRTKWIILVLGLFFTIVLNVNTITIAKRLSTDTALRSMIVQRAETVTKQPEAPPPDFEKNRRELEGLSLPIGWPGGFYFIPPWNPEFGWWKNLILPFFGWLLTAAAITLGAPFWFDMLNKIMVVRATVKPHEKSPEESSEDRQTKGGGGGRAPSAFTPALPAPAPAPAPAPPPAPAPAPAPAPRQESRPAPTPAPREVAGEVDNPDAVDAPPDE